MDSAGDARRGEGGDDGLLDSMQSIVERCFHNAMIVIDCFHIIKRVCDGMDEMRIRFKRKATNGQKKKREFNRKKALRKKARAYYRKRHPRKRGEKRGRPRLRANEKYIPKTLSNGEHRSGTSYQGKVHTAQEWRWLGQESKGKE